MLSNQELRKVLSEDPTVVSGVDNNASGVNESSIQPSSIDLTVGRIFIPPDANDDLRAVREVDDFYILQHGSTVLVQTKERINLPSNLGGIMFPKNGHFALKGLSITNFGHIDPGFQGHLKYTVINFGSDPFRLEIGHRIATMLLFELKIPSDPDWKTTRRHDADRIATHAKVLSRDFLDMERRIESRVKEEVEGFIRKRDRLSSVTIPIIGMIIALVLTVVGVVVGVVFPFYQHLDGKIDAIQRESGPNIGTDSE